MRKTFLSQREAKAWRAQQLVDISKGRAPKKLSGQPTLATAAEEFIAGARAGAIPNRSGQRFKPAAIRGYERCLRLRVLPVLGSMRLGEIERTNVQDLVDALQAQGIAAKTIRNTLDPLCTIYRRAIRRNVVTVDPTDNLEVFGTVGRRERIANPGEGTELLNALEEDDRALWATALYAGLRRGELRALRWSDVDLEARRLRVERSWDDSEGEQAPKSAAAHRTVPILRVLLPLLREHKLRTGRGGNELVFGAEANRAFMPSTVRSRALRAWNTANERREESSPLQPIGLHECRHTFASILIAAGENPKMVQKLMGHASIGMTMDTYAKLFEDAEETALTRADAFLDQQAGERRALRVVG